MFIAIILSFLLGQISFALILGAIFHVEIEEVGSGNPGATNVARALGSRWGKVTFLLDGLKGAAAAGLGFYYCGGSHFWMIACVAAAVFGHAYSPMAYIWLVLIKKKRGKRIGGKGVSTYFGGVCAIEPILALCVFSYWAIATVGIKKWAKKTDPANHKELASSNTWIASVSVNVVMIIIKLCALATGGGIDAYIFIGTACFVIYNHWGNMFPKRAR